MITAALNNRLNELVSHLSAIEAREHAKKWQTPPEVFCWMDGKRWAKINTRRTDDPIGTCGCWLVEISTGELYNIQGYGVPDHNKKRKATIGNVWTVDAEYLWSKRWNPLR